MSIFTSIFKFLDDSSILKYRRSILTLAHLLGVVLTFYGAFVLRFESFYLDSNQELFLYYLPLLLLIRVILYVQSGLHKYLWRYSSIHEIALMLRTMTLGSIMFFLVVRYLIGNTFFPRSIFIIDWLLVIFLMGGSSLVIRILRDNLETSRLQGKKILIVGADDQAELVLRNINKNPAELYVPIGIIDEDRYKKGLMIHGVPILGRIKDIPEVIKKYTPDEILISVPLISNKNIRQIYDSCKECNILVKKLPQFDSLLNGQKSLSIRIGKMLTESKLITETQLENALILQDEEGGRLGSKIVKLGYISEEELTSFLVKNYGISHMDPISLEDLLQRAAVKTDIQSVKEFISGKSVLVTGAGGSIGSELCRQLAHYKPSNLIMFDRYENTLFDLDNELQDDNENMFRRNITPIIGDILDKAVLRDLFSKYQPQVVFHAAAYKHVPLMEHNPSEAVKNNITGTKCLLNISSKYNVESFVMISTDKAVNPTSIMGATKRIAELLTARMNSQTSTKCTTVRFGNVLGSSGSVIPTFKEQLKKGGPLTVTHPDINRFFMLIPEAIQLVLIAASSGNGGETFVLDMGEPINILEMAENIIRLSGFIPHEEVRINITGLRPGEKIHEELFDESEEKIPTFHEQLNMAVSNGFSKNGFDKDLKELECIARNNDSEKVIPAIQKILPNFKHDMNVYEMKTGGSKVYKNELMKKKAVS